MPGVQEAVVEAEKITGYLLDPKHPGNRGKARFFLALWFSREGWQTLAAAFRRLATTGSVVKVVEGPHGRKYVVEGRIATPAGRAPAVRTIWLVGAGPPAPRLVTAYPIKGGTPP